MFSGEQNKLNEKQFREIERTILFNSVVAYIECILA